MTFCIERNLMSFFHELICKIKPNFFYRTYCIRRY